MVITSDLDEIPDPHLLINTEWVKHNTVYSLGQKTYYYNLRCKLNIGWWYGSRICRGGVLNKFSAQDIRSHMANCHSVQLENSGWHYSYFGDYQFIKDKIESFAHTELDHTFYKDNISQNVCNMRDLFGRDSITMIEVPIDLFNHSKYVVENVNSELIHKFI